MTAPGEFVTGFLTRTWAAGPLESQEPTRDPDTPSLYIEKKNKFKTYTG
nr:hypothetical protein IKGEJPOP_00070 [Human alphaherpesvirus 3]